MGTFKEELYFPLDIEEAQKRIKSWREGPGKNFKLEKHFDNGIHIKHKTHHIIITYLRDKICIESWVGGITKYSIAPNVIVGAIARRKGWKNYLTLRNILTEGIDSGALV